MLSSASHDSLAARLGLTTNVSPLRMKARRLRVTHVSDTAATLEEWLVDVANARGFRAVFREPGPDASFVPPSREELGDEELVACLCLPSNADQPHILRPAAQMISRGGLDTDVLLRLAQLERLSPIFAALAESALEIDPRHDLWRRLQQACAPAAACLRERPLHKTRLAEPVMAPGKPNAQAWKLIA